MKSIEMIQKLSVLHCVYQTIASADGSIDAERDNEAIDFALSELGLGSAYSWNSALQLNPHDCFLHVSGLSDDDKRLFKTLLLTIAGMGGNKLFRTNCANHIFQLCKA
jgi:hypothetical protein